MARSTREVAAANRERVLEQAARLFRERGIEAAGVNDIMVAAGLTHGGFYRHFASKSDLAAEAVTRSLKDSASMWHEEVKSPQPDDHERGALTRIVGLYLSEAHRDAPGHGCALAALGAETCRLPPEARAQVASGAQAMVEALADALARRGPSASASDDAPMEGPNDISSEARDRAMVTLATMLGALQLARLRVGPDDGLHVLELARADILADA